MKFSLRLLFLFAFLLSGASQIAFAQVDSSVAQITSSNLNSFARDISGDGRFVVFESTGDIATERTPDTFDIFGTPVRGRNNADGNTEIFLFDYAQRRIFQITNTRRALKNVAGASTAQSNIRVDVVNIRPVISNDGRWISFVSNATTVTASGTPAPITGNINPGLFDGNVCAVALNADRACPEGAGNRPTAERLEADGNTEIWLYQVPAAPAIDLASGAEPAFVDLSAGTFTQVTNTPASFAPVAGTDTNAAIVRDDNNLPSINDDGSAVAYVSDRDIITGSNAAPGNDNREIFVYRRTAPSGAGANAQVTRTPRGSLLQQIFNVNPSISGDGLRVAFGSTANNPLTGAADGNNADANLEVFYANLNAAGAATGYVQVTRTAITSGTGSQVVNLFNIGRRISRDGRFVAFETLSDNPETGGTNQAGGYGLYVFDATPPAGTASRYSLVGVRSFDDTGVVGGDTIRAPVFTDYNAGGTPASVVFTSRNNYRADGTVSVDGANGVNADPSRPPQIYADTLAYTTGGTPTPVTSLVRLSNNPPFQFQVPDLQARASNSRRRIAFSLSFTELGGNNSDLSNEGFYLLSPLATLLETGDQFRYLTGASARPVGSPLPIASPSPLPSPSPSASPVATPTPITPSAVRGLSPGMLATVRFTLGRPTVTATATGASTARRFELPIELGGTTLSFSPRMTGDIPTTKVAAGLYAVDRRRGEITFVVPSALNAGTYNVAFVDNGRVSRGTVEIIITQPDVFTKFAVPSSGGRARVFNATRRALQSEPFRVFTFDDRPQVRRATTLRLFLTGVAGAPASVFSIRIGNTTISGAQILTDAVLTDQPGVYRLDFNLPPELAGAGDVPIIVTITAGGNTFQSRLDDTAPRLFIL